MVNRTILIPTTPFYVLFITEILNRTYNEKMIRNLDIFITVICIFIINIDVEHTRDRYDNYEIRAITYDAYYNKNNEMANNEINKLYDTREVIKFYRKKIVNEYNYEIFRHINE